MALTEEDIPAVKKLIHQYKILLFKNQGVLDEEQLKDVALKFGSETSDKYLQFKHAKRRDVMVMSNDGDHGVQHIGNGWHIDGYYSETPHGHCLYHMVTIPKKGPTMFLPFTDFLASLSNDTFAYWDRVWVKYTSPIGEEVIHPFIYPHPITGNNTICLHLKYVEQVIFDSGSDEQRIATAEETLALTEAWKNEFDKNDGYWHYLHYWEEGDIIITDNLAVGHRAHPDAFKPAEEVGLRVLKRACVVGKYRPVKPIATGQETNYDRDEL